MAKDKEPEKGSAEGSIEVNLDTELKAALEQAEQKIEQLGTYLADAHASIELLQERVLNFAVIAALFGVEGKYDTEEQLIRFLALVAEQWLNPAAVQADDRRTLEQRAGTNDPRLIVKWLVDHQAE